MEDINRIAYFHNPLKESFTFRWDKAPTIVPKKTTQPMVYFLARHGAKHLTDHIILHPEIWPELGLKRTDDGRKKDKDGEPIISNLAEGREEIEKMILLESMPQILEPKEKKTSKKEDAEETFPGIPKS